MSARLLRGSAMTMPDERTRSLLWVGGFLIELAQDGGLPLTVRGRALIITRHFPAIEDAWAMASFRHQPEFGLGLTSPTAIHSRNERGRLGPLRCSTRFAWPEEA